MRYAHAECAAKLNVKGIVSKSEIEQSEKNLDEIQLKNYIDELWDKKADYPMITRQLKIYTGPKYKYTYKGIHHALQYYYEVTHHPISMDYKTIGIVPYVYNKAEEYYKKISEARTRNKKVGEIEKNIQEIHIPIPQTTVKKRELFTFFEEDN